LLELFDDRGRKVANLFHGYIPAGESKIITYQSDLAQLAQATYIYRLTRGNQTLSGRVVLITTMEDK